MTLELRPGPKSRKSASLERRARGRWSHLLWLASTAIACGGPAAPGLETNDGISASAGSASSSEASWCEIQPILQQKCQRCHQLSPEHGAPFSLLTYADTQEDDGKGNSRFQLMAAAIDSGYMPPQFIKLDPPVEPLTAEERASLLLWCSQGATLNESDSCPGNH